MNYDDLDFDAPLSLKVWRKMTPYILKYRRHLAVIAVMMIVCSLVDIAYPLLLSYAIDNFIVPDSGEGLGTYMLVVLGIVLIQSAAVFIFIRAAVKVEVGFGKALRHDVFFHIQKLSVSYFNTTPVGYILARVMSDTTKIGDMIAWSLIDLLWAVCYITGAFITMFILSWKLALLVLVVMPPLALITVWFQNRLFKTTRKVRKQNSLITAAFNEGITGARTTKSLGLEDHNADGFSELTEQMYMRSRRVARLNSLYMPLIVFVGMLSMALVLWRGSDMVMFEGLAIGIIAAFVSFAASVFEPIQIIARVLSDFVASSANVERVCVLLDRKPDVADTPEVIERYGDSFNPKPQNFEPIIGEIELKNVTFRYPDGGVNVLEDFSLHIPAGTLVALVGETGAGKSTLVSLICRFFEPTSGAVLLDGKDLRLRSQFWLHGKIGYVLQNPHLFSGTVRENIRYGRLDASDEEVESAAKLVYADRVIGKMENEYDTEVGEGGERLSTGEKQLISFARAVLADPRIFVLDEATSSVDTETERLIRDATDFMLRGRTSFIIAHRLSTVRDADIILVVKDGVIIERGTHDVLIGLKRHYYDLYTRQYESAAVNLQLGGKD